MPTAERRLYVARVHENIQGMIPNQPINQSRSDDGTKESVHASTYNLVFTNRIHAVLTIAFFYIILFIFLLYIYLYKIIHFFYII